MDIYNKFKKLFAQLPKEKQTHYINDMMRLPILVNNVRAWGINKGLNDPVMQYTKCIEEFGEIASEITRNHLDSLEMKDAIGDTLVTLIILADILNLNITDCLEQAYNEIKDRKGKTINGSFIKEVK